MTAGEQCLECGHLSVAVRLPTPCGRPAAVGGPYCEAHGGLARAEAEARRDWFLVAPESVGDAEAVLDAGNASLSSPEAIVVIRDVGDREPGPKPWRAYLGVGAFMRAVENPEASRTGRRGKGGKPRGRCAFASAEDALRAGLDAWRTNLDARVAEIRALRGGTLDWGMPVVPRREPIVLRLERGDHRSAWDAYAAAETEPRNGPELGSTASSGT